MTRPAISPARRAIARDLLTDARCAYRDARHFPNSAAALLPYAAQCRKEARLILAGHAVTLDCYGWPTVDTLPDYAPDA